MSNMVLIIIMTIIIIKLWYVGSMFNFNYLQYSYVTTVFEKKKNNSRIWNYTFKRVAILWKSVPNENKIDSNWVYEFKYLIHCCCVISGIYTASSRWIVFNFFFPSLILYPRFQFRLFLVVCIIDEVVGEICSSNRIAILFRTQIVSLFFLSCIVYFRFVTTCRLRWFNDYTISMVYEYLCSTIIHYLIY